MSSGDAEKVTPDRGRLQPIAARVLMKVLYAARLARYDLLRAVNGLAKNVTKWTNRCDAQLHRLMCYIHHTVDIRLVSYMGDQTNYIPSHQIREVGGKT